jgi:hypothetical protein
MLNIALRRISRDEEVLGSKDFEALVRKLL